MQDFAVYFIWQLFCHRRQNCYHRKNSSSSLVLIILDVSFLFCRNECPEEGFGYGSWISQPNNQNCQSWWHCAAHLIHARLDSLSVCSLLHCTLVALSTLLPHAHSHERITLRQCTHYLQKFTKVQLLIAVSKGRLHRPGLTPQLANPRLRDNRGLSPACIPSLSVNLTAHLTCDLTSFL